MRTHFIDPLSGQCMCRPYPDPKLTPFPGRVSCSACRKKMERQFKPIGEAFVTMVAHWLERQGAVRRPMGGFYEYVLETKAGQFSATPRPTCIYCHFLDVERAKQLLPHTWEDRLNPYSGKWNWHWEQGASVFEFQQFTRMLTPLLCTDLTAGARK